MSITRQEIEEKQRKYIADGGDIQALGNRLMLELEIWQELQPQKSMKQLAQERSSNELKITELFKELPAWKQLQVLGKLQALQ